MKRKRYYVSWEIDGEFFDYDDLTEGEKDQLVNFALPRRNATNIKVEEKS